MLTPVLLEAVDRCIGDKCVALNTDVVAFGGVADHVHLFVRMPSTVSVAELVKQVKGSSSHLASQRMRTPFRWQGRYGAFTISPSHVSRVRDYVLNQARHHASGSANPVLEQTEEDVDPPP